MHPFQQFAVAVTCIAFVFANYTKFNKLKTTITWKSDVLWLLIPIVTGILFICMAVFGNKYFQILGMVFAILGALFWHYILHYIVKLIKGY